MKRILLLLIFVAFLAGCSAEWYEHDTVYKNHSHMFYSWGGYKNTTAEHPAKNTTTMSNSRILFITKPPF